MSSSPSTTLQASATGASTPLAHFWSAVVGAGRANEGLRADWQDHLRQVSQSCGFRYVRFHGLFHDDMHVYTEGEAGKPMLNFQYVDALFDAMLDMGVRPFVEFGFMPSALASGAATTFWWKGNISPPKDTQKWSDLVVAIVSHWVARYGMSEVEQWYFECWNEPNLDEFWAGTRTQYYELYRATALAVRSVSAAFRVGGPATSNYVPDSRFDGEVEDTTAHSLLNEVDDIDTLEWRPVWVEHFLQWCSAEGLPVDFVSCHPYPTDWALDTAGSEVRRVRKRDASIEDLELVKKIVLASPYPSAEVHLTEWSSSPSPRDHSHDYVPAAIYVLRTMLASAGLVESVAYWTFTDVFEEQGAGPEPFHGGFGMINLQGILKPTFHAFRFLGQLGDESLASSREDGVVTRHSKTGGVSAILFHYPPEMIKTPPISFHRRDEADETLGIGSPVTKRLLVSGLSPGAEYRVEELVPGRRGDVISAWKAMGAPSVLSRDVARDLRAFSATLESSIVVVDESGTLLVDRELAPWSALCVSPAP